MRHTPRRYFSRAPLPPPVKNPRAEEEHLEAVFTGTFVSDAELVDDDHLAQDLADDKGGTNRWPDAA